MDALHVGEIGYAAAEDETILECGREDGRVVVTLDADFHTLLALSGATSPPVIRLRIEGLRGEAAAALLQAVMAQFDEYLEQGAALTVQEGRVRVRRLPLRSEYSRWGTILAFRDWARIASIIEEETQPCHRTQVQMQRRR